MRMSWRAAIASNAMSCFLNDACSCLGPKDAWLSCFPTTRLAPSSGRTCGLVARASCRGGRARPGPKHFRPHTSQKACVVIGCKRPKPTRCYRDEEILFFISERDGKDHRGRLAYALDGETIDHDLAQPHRWFGAGFELLQEGRR